jgi:hypothetical protein
MAPQLFLGDNFKGFIEERIQALGAADVDADIGALFLRLLLLFRHACGSLP